MTCSTLVFRNGVRLDDPTELAVLFLENDYSYRSYDSVPVPKDLDANRESLECVQRELEAREYTLSLCRILDLYTWAYSGGITPAWAVDALEARRAAPTVEARVDEVAELADDLGITLDPEGAARALLDAAIRELGYLPARREIRRWFEERGAE